MRCLVTGGAGFIGSHLCDRLLGAGHEVVAVDNLYTGSRRNLSHLEGHERFVLSTHDVTEPFPALGSRFDRVYHLACPASPPQYQRDPIFTLRTNFLGTMHALELAVRDSARLLLASTSEVYGDPEVHPQREDYRGSVNPIGPRANYDEGKRVAEALAFDFARSRGADIRVARIFNTYGPRMDPNDGRVVSNLIVQALSSKPLTIYGDGSQTRSFCYVDDLLDGLVGLMENASERGPMNLGNPVEITVLELARAVQAVVGIEREIVHEPLPVDDPRRRCPDISFARRTFGFAPAVPLAEGIAKTVAYFQSQLSFESVS